MKLVFFAFKHRYRFKDLNNFLYSRAYGKYFLLNLSGPFKHIFAKILIKFKKGYLRTYPIFVWDETENKQYILVGLI